MRKRTKQARSLRRLRNRRSDPPRIKVRGPEDFLAIVPYLLGFHPTESVVILFFERGRIALTARMDLPGVCGAPPTLRLLADQIVELAQRVRAESIVLICYSTAAERRQDFDEFARDTRLATIEALQVSPTHWWSLLCTRLECCPSEGTPYDLSGHPLCAEAVLAGMGALPDRSAVAAFVNGPPAEDLERLDDLGSQRLQDLARVDRTERKRHMRRAIERALAEPTALTDDECAQLAALCVDLEVRDVAWALMTRESADSHLALWRRVVSRTGDWLTPGPLGLESLAAWIGGDGALLNCGIARLESLRPDYGLLEVLRDLSWRALPPSAWDRLGPAMRAELDARIAS